MARMKRKPTTPGEILQEEYLPSSRTYPETTRRPYQLRRQSHQPLDQRSHSFIGPARLKAGGCAEHHSGILAQRPKGRRYLRSLEGLRQVTQGPYREWPSHPCLKSGGLFARLTARKTNAIAKRPNIRPAGPEEPVLKEQPAPSISAPPPPVQPLSTTPSQSSSRPLQISA